MNMVDLRRTQRKGMACAAVAAFAALGVLPATAEVANPNLVPANSAYVVSVPDSSALWSAWEGNALYGAYQKVMAMPEVQEKTADVRQQLSVIESSLGFKLDGPTLAKIFSAGDLYFPAPEGNDMQGVAILKVADADKAAKLIDLAEKAAAKAAASDDADEDTTGTVKTDAATSAITTADYNGIQIKSVKNSTGKTTAVYARAADLLIVAANDALIKSVIDRTKATEPGADSMGALENYKKVNAGLANEKGELYIYGNPELAWNSKGNNDIPATLRGPLQAFMGNVQPVDFSGTSIKIAPKEIYSYSHGNLKPGSENSLAVKNPGDQPLKVASYLPENTLWGVATSLLDPKSLSDLIGAAASENDEDGKMSQQVKSAETALGFSIKEDLVPALSNEFAMGVNRVELTGLIPAVDAVLVFGVKDNAKMTKVVEGAEQLIAKMTSKSSDDSTGTPAFKSEEVDGKTIKYTELQGLPNVAPGYVLADNYLIIGSSRSALSGAIKAAAGDKNLAAGAALTKLGHNLSGNANIIQYLDMSKIMELAKQVTRMIPAARDAGKYIDAVNVVDASASTSRIENNAVITRGVAKMK